MVAKGLVDDRLRLGERMPNLPDWGVEGGVWVAESISWY